MLVKCQNRMVVPLGKVSLSLFGTLESVKWLSFCQNKSFCLSVCAVN